MIRVARITGSHRASSVRRFLLTSCATLAAAGIMLLATPFAGPSPARAQFTFGGFHITIGGYGHRWRRGHHSSRSARRHRHDNDEDTPDPDTGSGGSSTQRATATTATPPPSDSSRTGPRPASSQPEPRTASGRPEPRGPDLEPSK